MSFIFCLLCYFLLFFHNNRAPGNSMQPMPVWRLCSAPSVLHIAGFLLPASPEVTNIMLFQSSLTDATWAKVYFCYFHAACKIPKNKNPTISHRVLYLLRCGRDSNADPYGQHPDLRLRRKVSGPRQTSLKNRCFHFCPVNCKKPCS